MKVLVVGEAPFIPSSFGKVTHYIVSGLVERGHKVVVAAKYGSVTMFSYGIHYSPSASCRDPSSERIKGFSDLCRPGLVGEWEVFTVEWPSNIRVFLETVFDADVILAYGTPYAPPLAEFLRDAYESRIDVPIAGYFVSESLVLPKAYGLHVGNSTVFASPSKFIRWTFIRSLSKWGIPEEEIRGRSSVVYHGVDLNVYNEGTRKYFREHHPLLEGVVGEGEFIVGTFAKNHVRKDLSALVFAYASLPKELRERSRLLVSLIKGCGGDDVWKLDLIVEAAEHYGGVSGLGDRVIDASDHVFGGFTEWQVLRVYSAMDLFVFPTRGEAFGLPPLEAGLLGIPPIVTAHPVMLELWGDAIPEEFFVLGHEFVTGEGLVLYAPDIMDLRRALIAGMKSGKLRERAVEGVKERVKELKLSREGMVDGIEELLKRARDIGPSFISDLGGGKSA